MTTYELSDDQVDLIAYAVRQVYFFEAFDDANPDCHVAADVLVALGYNDPREEDE